MVNSDIATPISGVVPQPGATLPYSEFKGFNKFPKPVCLSSDLELVSIVCIVINPILFHHDWLRFVDFVYYCVVVINKRSYS